MECEWMNIANSSLLSRFGFSLEKGGAHIARSMMLNEIRQLLAFFDDRTASKADYITAIKTNNCLGKPSGKSRDLAARHLIDLYSLDSEIPIFRTLKYFWSKDEKGQPLLALLCAYARDAVLRTSAPFIFNLQEGAVISRENTEDFIESADPGRFSKATLKSTSQNINTTWTQSGHLSGRVLKVRKKVQATPGPVAFALFLSYLHGARGEMLFCTEYCKLLDCHVERAIGLAETASAKGWITFKRIGRVMEVSFPNLLTTQEMEWLREQG